jgi:Tol biopolymer transport system component
VHLHWLLSVAFTAAVAAGSGLPTPSIFAPGVISSGSNDGAPTFSPDGRTLYFERTNGKMIAILESSRVGGRWLKPELASFSGVYADQQPAMSPDGRYMLYASGRALGDKRVSHIYRVERSPTGWSAPVELSPEINFATRVFKPSVAANGDIFFMADIGQSGPPKWRLFDSKRTAAGYAKAQPLPFSGPDDGDVDPFVAPDGSYLIFSSNSRSEMKDGHEHLFMVTRRGSRWSAVRPLRYTGDDWGADDGEAQVSRDGLTLYFTSGRVTPWDQPRSRAKTAAALARMDVWDNSNSNVWMLPLADYRPAS